jgi:ribosomal-protein-alanine N-acetyltransferase
MSAVLEPCPAVLRPMHEIDLDEIIEIENQSYEFPWGEVILRDCLRVGYCCWVLECGGRIDGYGIMSVGAGECHVLNLCVRNIARRQGFGRMILDRLLGLGRKHNASTAFLEVRPSNVVALDLYRSAGFNEVGVRRNYYPDFDGREDALILARRLEPGAD